MNFLSRPTGAHNPKASLYPGWEFYFVLLKRKEQGSASPRNAATFKATLVLAVVKLLPDDERTGDGNCCAEINNICASC